AARRRLVPMGRLVATSFQLFRVRSLERAAVQEHAEAGAGEAAAPRLARLHSDAWQPEPGDRIRHHVERHAEVEAGAEEHIASDAARAVEMIAGHGSRSVAYTAHQATMRLSRGAGRRGTGRRGVRTTDLTIRLDEDPRRPVHRMIVLPLREEAHDGVARLPAPRSI